MREVRQRVFCQKNPIKVEWQQSVSAWLACIGSRPLSGNKSFGFIMLNKRSSRKMATLGTPTDCKRKVFKIVRGSVKTK